MFVVQEKSSNGNELVMSQVLTLDSVGISQYYRNVPIVESYSVKLKGMKSVEKDQILLTRSSQRREACV